MRCADIGKGLANRISTLRNYRQIVGTPMEEEVLGLISDMAAEAPTGIGIMDRWAVGRCVGKHLETWVRQYLTHYGMPHGLLLAVIDARAAGGQAAAPLPLGWRQWLAKRGGRFLPFTSAARLRVQALAQFTRGIFRALRLLKHRNLAHTDQQPYAVAFNLTPLMLPSTNPNVLNLGNWYRSLLKSRGVDTLILAGATPVTSLPSDCRAMALPFPSLNSRARLAFAAEAVAILLRVALSMLVGRWAAALATSEAITAAYVSNISSSQLAREYLFHNGEYLLRPLWSYVAEAAGAPAVLTFYSTNCERIATVNRPWVAPLYGYRTMSWTHYRVWDDAQKDFLSAQGHCPASVELFETIPSEDNGLEWQRESRQLTVAVFDVMPFRPLRLADKGAFPGYYTVENICRFYEDLIEIAKSCGVHLLIKRKRDIPAQFVPADYRRTQAALSASGLATQLDPGMAAERLISQVDAVISTPFTSTAILGRQAGKPSIFYDPTSELLDGQRSSRGIPVLKSRLELVEWLNALTAKRATSTVGATA